MTTYVNLRLIHHQHLLLPFHWLSTQITHLLALTLNIMGPQIPHLGLTRIILARDVLNVNYAPNQGMKQWTAGNAPIRWIIPLADQIHGTNLAKHILLINKVPPLCLLIHLGTLTQGRLIMSLLTFRRWTLQKIIKAQTNYKFEMVKLLLFHILLHLSCILLSYLLCLLFHKSLNAFWVFLNSPLIIMFIWNFGILTTMSSPWREKNNPLRGRWSWYLSYSCVYK